MGESIENARGQSEQPNADQLPEGERFAYRASAMLRSRSPRNDVSVGVSVRFR
jgi:hypothetical protein